MPTLEETANRHMIVPNNPPHRPDETEKLSAATNPSTNQSEHSAVDTPERPRFTTYGAAFKHGFLGGRYKVAGRTVPIIPKNFVNSVGRMLDGMGELGLNILKEGAKEFALPGSSEGYQMARFVVTELIKEILTPLPQEARQAFREYFKAQERSAPTEEIQRLKEHFDRLATEADPISTEVGKILGDEVFYFTDRQKLIDKIAHEPAEVFSDVVAAVAAIMTAGASVAAVKAPRLAKMLQTGAKVAKAVDPAELPAHAIQGTARGITRTPAGSEAKQFNPSRPVTYGQTESGEALTSAPTSVELADSYGAGVEFTPDSMLNPGNKVDAHESQRRGRDDGIGIQARDRLRKTERAIENTRDRMIKDLDQGINPFNAKWAAEDALTVYRTRQWEDKVDFRPAFDEAGIDFARRIPEKHNWRKNWDSQIDQFESPVEGGSKAQVVPTGVEQAQKVLDEILEYVDVSELTLSDIDGIRAKFLERMPASLQEKGVNALDSKRFTRQFYDALTEDLYDAIEATVNASSGKLPESLLDDVKRAKSELAQFRTLRDTPGGKFLLENENNPERLIDGLLFDAFGTEDIDNFYKLMGSHQSANIQAAIMYRIFEKAPDGADGLQRILAEITENNPNRIVDLFGGGDRGREIAKELAEFADFSARLPEDTLPTNPTGKGNTGKMKQALLTATLGGAMKGFVELAKLLFPDSKAAALSLTSFGMLTPWLYSTGRDWLLHSDWGRKRLREGHIDPELADKILRVVAQTTKPGRAKAGEIASRFATSVEEEKDTAQLGRLGTPPKK